MWKLWVDCSIHNLDFRDEGQTICINRLKQFLYDNLYLFRLESRSSPRHPPHEIYMPIIPPQALEGGFPQMVSELQVGIRGLEFGSRRI